MSDTERVDRLTKEAVAREAEAAVLAESFDESTDLSWLWALLFGPIYFAFHGFWGHAVLIFVLWPIVIGFIVAPFLVYPAWKKRAQEKAEMLIVLDSLRRT